MVLSITLDSDAIVRDLRVLEKDAERIAQRAASSTAKAAHAAARREMRAESPLKPLAAIRRVLQFGPKVWVGARPPNALLLRTASVTPKQRRRRGQRGVAIKGRIQPGVFIVPKLARGRRAFYRTAAGRLRSSPAPPETGYDAGANDAILAAYAEADRVMPEEVNRLIRVSIRDRQK